MALRIATFNTENLMQRFEFPDHKLFFPGRMRHGRGVKKTENLTAKLDQSALLRLGQEKMHLTARAIADTDADIVCLQEVENIEALEFFERNYLSNVTTTPYRHKVLLDGNDGRGIDVAVLARSNTRSGSAIEIKDVISHAHISYGDLDLMNRDLVELKEEEHERVFRRDCLVVDLEIGGTPLTLILLHLKSMGTDKEDVDGRTYTMPVRKAEATAVRRIIESRSNNNQMGENWLICGDLNDYCHRIDVTQNSDGEYTFVQASESEYGFRPLIEDGFSENLVARLPENNQWTLFHSRSEQQHHLVQLDYILASPHLAKINAGAIPRILRQGQPHRVVFPPSQNVIR